MTFPSSAPARRAALRYFGDYVLLGEIARGGMGVVYRALQTSLEREVAIKMIDAGKLANDGAVRRFHTEAEAMAKLDHPNIVTIHEIGEHEGHYYFAMKLVDGPNLAEHIANQPMPSREAAELLVTIARAVQYAHDRGVLHRDLKPSNILLDAEGKPHITDFGIAKLAERAVGLTGSVAILGTPEYMAPEQAVGKTQNVGIASDIYSLGAVLYHMLTGHPPFKGETTLEILDRVVKQAPTPVRSINPNVDIGLEKICLKCLEKEPKNRYSTAEILALDLEKWLSHRPIETKETKRFGGTAKWIGGHPVLAILIALLIVVICWSVRSSTTYWIRNAKFWARGGTSPITSLIANRSAVGAGITNQPNPINFALQSTTNMAYLKTSSSGIVREQCENTAEGELVQYFSFTGRLQRKDSFYFNGSRRIVFYDLNGEERREETRYSGGGKEVIAFAYDRNGQEHSREILQLNAKGKSVEKTLITQNNGVFDQTITNHFDQGQFGFVYRPADTANSPALLSWFDAYWFTSSGSPIVHQFHYAWSWKSAEWCQHFQYYWVTDDVYPSPAHWLTDWLIASYLADAYATQTSADQFKKEAGLARKEAGRAKQLAGLANYLTEVNEGKVAQANAELRARTAEENSAKVEVEEGKSNSIENPYGKATRIRKQTKEDLRNQIEMIIVAKNNSDRQAASGLKVPIPNVLTTLADESHIFAVSKTLSVIAATNASPAGTITAGDLLRLEPGLKISPNEANENTFIVAKIIASKRNEATVGTSILISLRDLQEFDSEFRARLDLGLAEARKSDPLFRQSALK